MWRTEVWWCAAAGMGGCQPVVACGGHCIGSQRAMTGPQHALMHTLQSASTQHGRGRSGCRGRRVCPAANPPAWTFPRCSAPGQGAAGRRRARCVCRVPRLDGVQGGVALGCRGGGVNRKSGDITIQAGRPAEAASRAEWPLAAGQDGPDGSRPVSCVGSSSAP